MNGLAIDSRACPFCSAYFPRANAARRHSIRCPQRGERELLDRKRGRPQRSCNQCSRVKVHCQPTREGESCKRCTPRKLACSLNGHSSDVASQSSTQASPGLCQRPSHGRVPLSFLLNSTDDEQDYFTEKTVGNEPDGAPLGPACLSLMPLDFEDDEILGCLHPSILTLFDYGHHEIPAWPEDSRIGCEETHLDDPTYPMSLVDMITARVSQLECELIRHAGRSPGDQASLDLHSYRSFFCAENVCSFVTTFCQKRHYQYPIIHWPTLQLETVSLALLLVVCLTGASYSFSEVHGSAHAVKARKFYELADSYVSEQLESQIHAPPTQRDPAQSVELCQAALLMYALITPPAGNTATQHVAITRRLPTLIHAIRELGFIATQHEPLESRQVFVDREQIIRLVAWTYCADCLATLSCNKPPGFSLMEMRGHLPCHPRIWDADALSFSALQDSFKDSGSFCLADLMANWLSAAGSPSFANPRLPVFHLHIMLCGKFTSHRIQHVALNHTQRLTCSQPSSK